MWGPVEHLGTSNHQVDVVSVVEMSPGDVLSPDWQGAMGKFGHRDGGPIGILCLRYLRHDGLGMKKMGKNKRKLLS
jgi:hypothetical protein